MVEVFGYAITNFGIYGGIGGIVILIVILWLIFKRKKGGRLYQEEEEIEEDKKLLEIDKRARAKEREEKVLAGNLITVLFKISNRSRVLGMKDAVKNNHPLLMYIYDRLREVEEEVVSLKKEVEIAKKLSDAVNVYLANMQSPDKKISQMIAEARKLQSFLNLDIQEEASLLQKKEALLRQEFMETKQEEAA